MNLSDYSLPVLKPESPLFRSQLSRKPYRSHRALGAWEFIRQTDENQIPPQELFVWCEDDKQIQFWLE